MKCSFCAKDFTAVKKLVAALDSRHKRKNVYICNECVDLAYEIVHSQSVVE